MSSYVRDTDRGWKRIERDLMKLAELEVVVGIQSDAPDPEGADGMNMAGLATVHEFGTDMAGKNHDIVIPERAPLRKTFDTEQANFEEAARRVVGLVMDGQRTPEGALGRLGQLVEIKIKKTIQAGLSPGLAASTITRRIKSVKGKAKRRRARKSQKPLLDTGALLGAIRYVVRPRTQGDTP
jgi:hypothetical protein